MSDLIQTIKTYLVEKDFRLANHVTSLQEHCNHRWAQSSDFIALGRSMERLEAFREFSRDLERLLDSSSNSD